LKRFRAERAPNGCNNTNVGSVALVILLIPAALAGDSLTPANAQPAAALLPATSAAEDLRALADLWCVLTAAIFHTKFSDLDQLMSFFKNMTMAGGFPMFAKNGSWGGSIDAALASRRQIAH
jgi:hypothetical protein